MNIALNNIRRISEVFFETMFLVFISAYSWADVHTAEHTQRDLPLSSAVAIVKQIVLRDGPVHSFVQGAEATHIVDGDFFRQVIDLPGIDIALSDELFTNIFTRHAFYIFTSTNAP